MPDEPEHPKTSDEPWDDLIKESPGQSAGFEQWYQQWVVDEVAAHIRDIRQDYGHMVYVDIHVVVPVCESCMYSYCRYMEQRIPLPDIFGSSWEDGYACFGMDQNEIDAVRSAVENRSYPWMKCRDCGSSIPLDPDINFWTRRESLSSFFELWSGLGRHVPKRVKKTILNAFERQCAACQRSLTAAEATMDHIVAVSQGGATDMINLQPLCKACNEAKANELVETVTVVLTFPLRPAPEGYEGVTW